MWLSLAVMLAESLASLLVVALRSARAAAAAATGSDPTASSIDPAPRAQRVPRSWWVLSSRGLGRRA
jgi:hypothetical protein